MLLLRPDRWDGIWTEGAREVAVTFTRSEFTLLTILARKPMVKHPAESIYPLVTSHNSARTPEHRRRVVASTVKRLRATLRRHQVPDNLISNDYAIGYYTPGPVTIEGAGP